MLKIRSGIGYDIHRLKDGDGLFLGGIKVSEELQFIAHSDGDVLIHALIDALLGASGNPDIGEMFPDTDNRYQNIKSELLLKKTLDILREKKYEIMNIDCVLIAQNPQLSEFKKRIKKMYLLSWEFQRRILILRPKVRKIWMPWVGEKVLNVSVSPWSEKIRSIFF